MLDLRFGVIPRPGAARPQADSRDFKILRFNIRQSAV
jgi:hypothetical protein